jgi:hypothetical protein
VQSDVSWEEVSPWLIITFWEHMDLLQFALQYCLVYHILLGWKRPSLKYI